MERSRQRPPRRQATLPRIGRRGNEANGPGGRKSLECAAGGDRARAEVPACAKGSQRRKERDRRNSRRNGRRRSLTICGRAFPYVLALCRIAGLESGNSGELVIVDRRNEG